MKSFISEDALEKAIYIRLSQSEYGCACQCHETGIQEQEPNNTLE